MKNLIKLTIILVLSLCCISMAAWADGANAKATQKTYFDLATGHKYTQNPDGSYTEFSRRGELLRSKVPNSLPLLVSGRHIIPLASDHYLVYERHTKQGRIHQLLPAQAAHPDGWICKDLVSQVLRPPPAQAEAYGSD